MRLTGSRDSTPLNQQEPGSVTFLPQHVWCGHGRERSSRLATIGRVTEESAQPLEQQLEEIRTQLAWVRDYL
jgi:hypothetical protein